MKLYELSTGGEKEWIAANTIIEALQEYQDTTSNHIFDLDPTDEIKEVPESEWPNIPYTDLDADDESEAIKTFADAMKGIVEPAYIASTCF